MLSIIIPAYNEQKNITKTINNLVNNLDSINRPYEIIIVSDGSKDKTFEYANRLKSSKIKAFEYFPNHGKGYALTFGTKHASGDVVTFIDAGGDFDAEHIDKFIKLMEVFDADIVIGSKRHPASQVNYPFLRRVYSKIYQLMIRLLFNLRISDTQAGLKVFKKKVLDDVLPRVLVKKYAFDLELLVIAKRLGYTRIFEAPVKMDFNSVTSGINFKAIYYIIVDTLAIFYRRYILRYYDKPHIKTQKIQNSNF